MKICNSCQTEKDLSEFVKHKECKDGYSNTCKTCKLLKQRITRETNRNLYTKKYEKTINGFLVRTYRNMKSRVTGIQKKGIALYLGKELLDKNTFYKYSIDNENFKILFNEWTNKNYDRKLTPSIDRINTKLGYTIDNIQWITHSENSKKGAMNRHKQDNL